MMFQNNTAESEQPKREIIIEFGYDTNDTIIPDKTNEKKKSINKSIKVQTIRHGNIDISALLFCNNCHLTVLDYNLK